MGDSAKPLGATRFWVWGLALAAVFSIVGYLAGAYVGTAVAEGFRFDWYSQPGVPGLSGEDAGLLVGLAAATVAIVAATVATAVAYRTFDRNAKGRFPPKRAGARTRDNHTVLTAAVYGLLLPLVLGLIVLILSLIHI